MKTKSFRARHVAGSIRIFTFLICLCAIPSLYAQQVLTGTVTDEASGLPLPGATLYIPDLKTGVAADRNGSYRFGTLPSGVLLIQCSHIGYEAKTALIDLRSTFSYNFVLVEKVIEAREVVITGSGISTDNSRTSTTITPILRSELLTTPTSNLISAISDVPGLSEITTSGDISKPVIRGLSYNHVVTLNEGIRQEGQQWGDEHGIEIDQFSADRIEVLKGPASLFYGSDAMGGVINILEPIHAPANSIRGELASQFATNNRMTNNSLMLEGNQEGVIWRARGSYKNAASFRVPGESIYNSCFNEMNYSAMAGLIRSWGYTHLHFSRYDAVIGMVEGERDSLTGQFLTPEGKILSDKEAGNRIPQYPYQRVRHSKISSVSNIIHGNSQYRVNIGYQDNRRREYEEEPGGPALWMNLATATIDFRFTHLFTHGWELVAGIGGMYQENRNEGSEAIVPDYFLTDAGGFLYGKKSWKQWTLNAGLRYDTRYLRSQLLPPVPQEKFSASADPSENSFHRHLSAFSGSAGMTFTPGKVLRTKLNIGSGYRAPNIAELGSHGVHPGTRRFETGNPNLHPEHSLQIDGEIAADWPLVSVTLNGFYNYIFRYIYQRNMDGETIRVDGDEFKVYRFVQGNSVLKGMEAEIDFHPVEELHFENSVDFVIGTNVSTGEPLPFIPALHTVHTLRWNIATNPASRFVAPWVQIGGQFHARQARIDRFETATDGYFLLDATVGTQLRVAKQLWTLFLSGTNLANKTYYDHLSRLKEAGIPNPGRSVTLGVVLPFGVYEK